MIKKYLLAIQGEGRGHMTQALTMYDLLIEKGQEVSAVIIGSSSRREIPKFMYERIKSPIIKIDSPNFVTDKKNKSINIPKSLLYNFSKIQTFKKSIQQIEDVFIVYKPDVVINFFDLMLGLYYRLKKPNIPQICIAHQYIYLHPEFKFPGGQLTDRLAIQFFTKITASGSCKQLALSFYNIKNPHKKVQVVPPLLRNDVFELNTCTEDFFLIYMVNNGYFEEIVEWHKNNPEYELHCFTDNPDFLKNNYSFRPDKLFVHAIDDKLFLEMMSKSRGIASSAGFESVCEAMYFSKPVLMVPVKGHFEQFCNSRDAFKTGAGIYSTKFDLDKLLEYSCDYEFEKLEFKSWLVNAKEIIYSEIALI